MKLTISVDGLNLRCLMAAHRFVVIVALKALTSRALGAQVFLDVRGVVYHTVNIERSIPTMGRLSADLMACSKQSKIVGYTCSLSMGSAVSCAAGNVVNLTL